MGKERGLKRGGNGKFGVLRTSVIFGMEMRMHDCY